MQTVPLTPREIAAVLSSRVIRLEESGIPRPLAIKATARERGLDGTRVAWLLGRSAQSPQSRETI